jgi:hypothetical protein
MRRKKEAGTRAERRERSGEPVVEITPEAMALGKKRWDEIWSCITVDQLANLLRMHGCKGKAMDPYECAVCKFLGPGSVVTHEKVKLPGYSYFLSASRQLRTLLTQLDSRFYSEFDDLLTDWPPE